MIIDIHPRKNFDQEATSKVSVSHRPSAEKITYTSSCLKGSLKEDDSSGEFLYSFFMFAGLGVDVLPPVSFPRPAELHLCSVLTTLGGISGYGENRRLLRS